jgi:hypothetical protein
VHDKDHPAWQADPGDSDYENGNTSQWAEDVHRGPYPDGNPPAAPGYDLEDQDHPAYKRPQRVSKSATFRRKVEKHAAQALRIAKAQLGRTASTKALEKHALNLMDLSPSTLQRMASRLKTANFEVGFDDGLVDDGFEDTGFDGGFEDTGFDGGFEDTGFDDGFVDDGFDADFEGDMGALDDTFEDDFMGGGVYAGEDMEECATCHSAEDEMPEEEPVDEEKEQLKEAVRSMYAKLVRLQKIARKLVAEEEDAGLDEVTDEDVEEAKEAAEDAEDAAEDAEEAVEEVEEAEEEAVEAAEEAEEAAEDAEEAVEEEEGEEDFEDSDTDLTALFSEDSDMDAMAGGEADDELLGIFAEDLSDDTMSVLASKQKPQPKKASKGPKTLGRITRTASAKDDTLASLWDAPSRDAMDQMKRIFGK